MMVNKFILGQRIYFYRKRAGLTQSQLAEKTGICGAAIGWYERGEKAPTLLTAYNMTQALGITLDQLVSEKVVIEI